MKEKECRISSHYRLEAKGLLRTDFICVSDYSDQGLECQLPHYSHDVQKGITSQYQDPARMGGQNYSLDTPDTCFVPCVSCPAQGSAAQLFTNQSHLNLSSP